MWNTAKRALVRDLLGPPQHPRLVNSRDLGRQAPVDAKDASVNQGGNVKIVENLAAVLPHVRTPVLLLALVFSESREQMAAYRRIHRPE